MGDKGLSRLLGREREATRFRESLILGRGGRRARSSCCAAVWQMAESISDVEISSMHAGCWSVCQACAISMWENPSAATVAPRRPETRVFQPLSTAQLSHAANKHGQTPGLVWCITYPSWTDKGCPPTASFPGVAADSQSGGRALQPASWRCPNRPSSSVLIPSSWWRPSLRRRDTGASLAAEQAVLPGDGARPRLDGREKQSAGGRKNNGRVPGRAAMCRAPACCLVSEGGDMTGPGVGGLVCRMPRVGFRGANSGE